MLIPNIYLNINTLTYFLTRQQAVVFLHKLTINANPINIIRTSHLLPNLRHSSVCFIFLSLRKMDCQTLHDEKEIGKLKHYAYHFV